MLERTHFVRYALRFERALANDDWRPVAECFARDAVYIMIGAAPFDGETRGAGQIAQQLRQAVQDLDRQFDRRRPRVTSWPRVRDGVLSFRWRVRYELGSKAAVLTGTTTCAFAGNRISMLRDDMPSDECRGVVALLASR